MEKDPYHLSEKLIPEKIKNRMGLFGPRIQEIVRDARDQAMEVLSPSTKLLNRRVGVSFDQYSLFIRDNYVDDRVSKYLNDVASGTNARKVTTPGLLVWLKRAGKRNLNRILREQGVHNDDIKTLEDTMFTPPNSHTVFHMVDFPNGTFEMTGKKGRRRIAINTGFVQKSGSKRVEVVASMPKKEIIFIEAYNADLDHVCTMYRTWEEYDHQVKKQLKEIDDLIRNGGEE